MADKTPRLAGLVAALRDVWRGASGDYAYEGYCRHLAERHPGTPIPGRADYEKRVQAERYNGIRRCC